MASLVHLLSIYRINDPDKHHLLQRIEEEKLLSNSFSEASIILISTLPDKDSRNKLETNIPDEHRCKNPKQNFRRLESSNI